MAGPTDFNYITPQEAEELYAGIDDRSADYFSALLEKYRGKSCTNCDLPAWAMVDSGMCFPCTTGESDASDDYELH